VHLAAQSCNPTISHKNANAFAFILLRTDTTPLFDTPLQFLARRLEQIESEGSHFQEQMQSVQQELESKLRVSQHELQLMQDALQQVTFLLFTPPAGAARPLGL